MYRMNVIVLAVVVLVCTGGEAMERKKHQKPEVIAHRGSSADAPENTLAAFRKADADNARWFELDCSLTADGVVVVIHDNDVDRTTGTPGTVTQMTLTELKALDAGSWKSPDFKGETIPTLGEALDLAHRKLGVYIEIKDRYGDAGLAQQLMELAAGRSMNDDALRDDLIAAATTHGTPNLELAQKVVAEIQTRKLDKRVVVQSFSLVLCALVRAKAPGLRVELLAADGLDTEEGWNYAVLCCERFGLHGLNPNHPNLNPERIASLHARGLTTAAWTVDDPARMTELADMSVDRIITNRPALCLEVLSKRK